QDVPDQFWRRLVIIEVKPDRLLGRGGFHLWNGLGGALRAGRPAAVGRLFVDLDRGIEGSRIGGARSISAIGLLGHRRLMGRMAHNEIMSSQTAVSQRISIAIERVRTLWFRDATRHDDHGGAFRPSIRNRRRRRTGAPRSAAE